MKILLVEDSTVSRKMEKKALNDIGMDNIVEAADGLEAIGILNSDSSPDLIISDWNMPGMTGYDLLVQVRNNSATASIPFIMATARSEKKEAARAVEAGVSGFITKPFGPDDLKKAIDDALIRKQGNADAQALDIVKVVKPIRTSSGKTLIRAAHIQITDHLPLGILKNLVGSGSLKPNHFEIETICMPSWNAVQNALERGEVECAFVLAPICMDLYAYGVPVTIILFAHKGGSICVRKKAEGEPRPLAESLRGKTFYIPYELSIHHMLAHMFLRRLGLNPGFAGSGRGDCDVFFEVVPPVKMPELLATNPDAGGFIVAEPLGTKAIADGTAELLFLSGEIWENHPCCVVSMRKEIVDACPEAVQEFADLIIQAGRFIVEKPETASEIAVSFLDPKKVLGLKVPILKNVLLEEKGISTGDLTPVAEDLAYIQKYMAHEIGIGGMNDLTKLVDLRFAKKAGGNLPLSMKRSSVMHDLPALIRSIERRLVTGSLSKALLNKEGKYLIFGAGKQEYGIDITFVREIIKMQSVTQMPGLADAAIKGIISLRECVIPVVDFNVRMGMEESGSDKKNIIVLEKRGINVGIIVDKVIAVADIKSDHIDDAGGDVLNRRSVLALAKMDNKLRLLVNVDFFMDAGETAIAR